MNSEKVSDERLRSLREKQFTRVLNTPRPTIEELEKILQREDVQVEIQPNGEVHAVADTDKELIVALIDECLASRAQAERDAKRYQWLRDEPEESQEILRSLHQLGGDELDAAIDAAIAKGEAK